LTETRKPGRPKGAVNKVTADVKAQAQVHTKAALAALVKIMEKGESEAAKVAAANSILDRGHGRPKQAVEASGPDGGPIEHSLTVKFV
jgi:hypothetical protein